MKKLTAFLFALISFCCPAQKKKLDSLYALLGAAQHDSVKVRLKYEIGEAGLIFRKGFWDSLQQQASAIGTRKYEALALNNLGYLYSVEGQEEKAFDYYLRALDIQRQISDKQGLSSTLNNLGVVYKRQGMLEKALELYFESLRIKEESGDKKGQAYALSNIAVIYFSLNEHAKGLEYDHKALKLREEIGDKEGIAQSLSNLGVDYIRTHPDKALEYFIRSLNIRKEIGGKRWIASTLNNIGFVFYTLAEREKSDPVRDEFLEKSLDYYRQSLEISEELVDKNGICHSLYYMGSAYFIKKDYKRAEEYCSRSLKIGREAASLDLIRNASERLSRVYKAQGRYKEALEMHELFKQMTDSANNVEIRKSALKKQLQYEFEKKEALAKAEQDKKNVIAEAEARKKNITILFTGLGLALVLVFAAFVFRSLRVTQKQKAIIEEQKKTVEMQKLIVEEKQKEIVDSIHYAKRIQDSLLPTDKYIERNLKKLDD
ncbi:MAG: tetratricopeptide repeat protein [Bacteroidota bacterium]